MKNFLKRRLKKDFERIGGDLVERIRYFENYLEICKDLKALVNRFADAKVFVFGSVAKGDFSIGLSDIDVAIVSDKFNERDVKLMVY